MDLLSTFGGGGGGGAPSSSATASNSFGSVGLNENILALGGIALLVVLVLVLSNRK